MTPIESMLSAAFVCAFVCDESVHTHCNVDRRLFPSVFATAVRPNDVQRRRESSDYTFQQPRPLRLFQHIPKAGGTTIENFLEIPFQDHMSMRRKERCSETKCPNYHKAYAAVEGLPWPLLLIMRHPVDRFISEYFYIKAGERLGGRYEERQRHFCKNATGRVFGNECIPQLGRNGRDYSNKPVYSSLLSVPTRLREAHLTLPPTRASSLRVHDVKRILDLERGAMPQLESNQRE